MEPDKPGEPRRDEATRHGGRGSFANDLYPPQCAPQLTNHRNAAMAWALKILCWSIVNRYAGDARVRTSLEELLRVKAVRRLAGKRLEVLSPTFATARGNMTRRPAFRGATGTPGSMRGRLASGRRASPHSSGTSAPTRSSSSNR